MKCRPGKEVFLPIRNAVEIRVNVTILRKKTGKSKSRKEHFVSRRSLMSKKIQKEEGILHKKARIVALAVAVIFLLGTIMPVGAADGTKALMAVFRNLKIVVNGSTLISDKEPFIVDGTTYVPIRLVAEATGATVEWDGAQGRVVITTAPSVDSAELQKKYQEGYEAGLKVGDANGYIRGLQEGKAQAQDKAKAEKDYDEGYDDGYDAGEEDGFEAGEYDGYWGNKNDWKRAIDNDSTIKKDKKISNKSDDYIDGFLKGYKEAFEEYYKYGYDYAEGYDIGYEYGYEDGKDAGSSAKLSIPSSSTIIRDNSLNKESKGFRDGFVEGYREGYEKGWKDARK